ncbi:MAG: 23S rRNA (uridine(2552)-2'-O)-methyltransferase RlmE [Boseongicola sp.]|nr:23S rRNA (uridine(2552)-2'-O)-methyltransferase RlmE [Boseongicola sp.]
MGRKGSSGRWLQEHHKDEYVLQAQREGYRSRAVYKLLELHERDRLIQRGQRILDLGAAPGGWCQVAAKLAGPEAEIVAVDILEMQPIEGVTFIQGDFREDQVLQKILSSLSGHADLVLSDMAPNISGIRSVDQTRSMYLAELALDCAAQVLAPGGSFVTKLFHGEGFDLYVKNARSMFQHVKVKKPKASRPRSRETYMVARGYEV